MFLPPAKVPATAAATTMKTERAAMPTLTVAGAGGGDGIDKRRPRPTGVNSRISYDIIGVRFILFATYVVTALFRTVLTTCYPLGSELSLMVALRISVYKAAAYSSAVFPVRVGAGLEWEGGKKRLGCTVSGMFVLGFGSARRTRSPRSNFVIMQLVGQ